MYEKLCDCNFDASIKGFGIVGSSAFGARPSASLRLIAAGDFVFQTRMCVCVSFIGPYGSFLCMCVGLSGGFPAFPFLEVWKRAFSTARR